MWLEGNLNVIERYIKSDWKVNLGDWKVNKM